MAALWEVSSPSTASPLLDLPCDVCADGYTTTQSSDRVDDSATSPTRRRGTVQEKTAAVFLLICQSPERADVYHLLRQTAVTRPPARPRTSTRNAQGVW